MSDRSNSQTALFLSEAIERSGITHIEIAERVGYGHPNVISMMRWGNMKVPLDRIPALAEACGADPRKFLRVALEEYQPEAWEVLRSAFGDVLTTSEQDLLAAFRVADQVGEIRVDAHLVQALLSLFELASQRQK